MQTGNTATAILCLNLAAYCQASFSADSETATKRETFRISLGGFITTFDTDIAYKSKNKPISVPLDLEDDLDFDEKADLGWIAAY
ncbi:MAG: hypothetical protein VB957_02750 [Pseudomonadales bacterium]|jgi:hypothetical protein